MSTRSSLGLTARHRVLGVAFLALLLLFVWVTTAVFTKKFVDYVPVTLTSLVDRAAAAGARGREDPRAPRRRRPRASPPTAGAPPCPWRSIPDQADMIPANVTARIVPKTLFGEKYVALQVPRNPSSRRASGRGT